MNRLAIGTLFISILFPAFTFATPKGLWRLNPPSEMKIQTIHTEKAYDREERQGMSYIDELALDLNIAPAGLRIGMPTSVQITPVIDDEENYTLEIVCKSIFCELPNYHSRRQNTYETHVVNVDSQPGSNQSFGRINLHQKFSGNPLSHYLSLEPGSEGSRCAMNGAMWVDLKFYNDRNAEFELVYELGFDSANCQDALAQLARDEDIFSSGNLFKDYVLHNIYRQLERMELVNRKTLPNLQKFRVRFPYEAVKRN